MFDNVVVGVDGRSGGRDAVALVKQLAAGDARITLAHVGGGTTMGGRASALAVPLELEASEQLLARAAADAGVHADTEVVYESSVGRGLHDLAERSEADLLVVGSCHRGMLGRTLLGDDTSRALNGAPCAVAIAPRGYAATGSAARPLSRIGVGCDVSAESAWALQVAHALAARHGSTIKALSVVSLQSIPYGEPIPAQWPKIAGQLVADELDRLADLDGVEGDATYGDPGEELAAFSGELDLLIVGSRSYGPVGRLFNGSTSNYLARRSSCPLLVLPRSAHRSEDEGGTEPAEPTTQSRAAAR
jgi:nucleotide-binding universal stress UspA family protein